MLGLTVTQAYTALFLLTLPISVWVAVSDLKYMKIPNIAVYALLGVFVVAGLALIPFEAWAWRWLNAIIVFAIGFLLWASKTGWGAGDVKFAAAAAPFFSQTMLEIQIGVVLLAFFMIATLVVHRIFRAIPAVRRATPDWVSWQRGKVVPVGVSLALTLSVYLALKAFPSFYGAVAGLFA